MSPKIVSFLILAGVLAAIFFLSKSKRSTSTQRVDFIAQASENLHHDEVPATKKVGNKSVDLKRSDQQEESNDEQYNYDVVGESFQRDHLVALVRNHKAFDAGVIYTTATLEPEPTNEFDPTAVKVIIEGTQVGYISKLDSEAVTQMIKRSGNQAYEVPARIGFDADSPQPLIGVSIALTVD